MLQARRGRATPRPHRLGAPNRAGYAGRDTPAPVPPETERHDDMRKRLILLLTPLAALAAIAVSASVAASPTVSSAAAATCTTVTDGQLTIGTDNPAYPPWFAGGSKSSWKINDPS